MKLTKNSIKRKVKSTVNPFYGKRGPGAKAGRAAISAGSGCLGGLFQLSWLMLYWTFYGMWLIAKWLFYTLPKLIIEKYKALNPTNKQITKIIVFSILILSFLSTAIYDIVNADYTGFAIEIILSIGLGVLVYFTIKKYTLLKQENSTVNHSEITEAENYSENIAYEESKS